MNAADIKAYIEAHSDRLRGKVHVWAGWTITMAQVDAFVAAHQLEVLSTPAMAVVDKCEQLGIEFEPQLVTPASCDREIEDDELFLLFPIAFGEFSYSTLNFEASGIAFTGSDPFPLPQCELDASATSKTLAEARDILQLDRPHVTVDDGATLATYEFTKSYSFVKADFNPNQQNGLFFLEPAAAKQIVQKLSKAIAVPTKDIPFRFMQDPQQRLSWMSMRYWVEGDGVHDTGGQDSDVASA